FGAVGLDGRRDRAAAKRMIVRTQDYPAPTLIIHEVDHGNRRGARIFPIPWLQDLQGFLSAKRLQSPVVARFIWTKEVCSEETAMPAKIIGMIGTQMEGVAVHLIKGKISREWVIDFTRLQEQWNYDSVLVGYYSYATDGFEIALFSTS